MYRWVEHTSELELELEGPSEEEIFREALRALSELLEGEQDGAPARHEVSASAPDRATLLVEWLNELLYLAESRFFVPEQVEQLVLGEDDLEGVVVGREATPRPLVKAITYHRLAFSERDGGWRARVVLDV